MLLNFLNLTVPPWRQWSVAPACGFPRPSSPSNARHSGSSIFFQFKTSISKHLEVILVIGQYLVDTPVAVCCLPPGIFFGPPYNLIFFVVSWITLSKLQAILKPVLVVFWIFVGLSFSHVNPSRIFVREIWNLVVPVHSSERWTPCSSLHTSLTICSETLSTLV